LVVKDGGDEFGGDKDTGGVITEFNSEFDGALEGIFEGVLEDLLNEEAEPTAISEESKALMAIEFNVDIMEILLIGFDDLREETPQFNPLHV
jgi:hypothetical protein